MSIRDDVLRKRYYLKDKEGNIIEDWEGLCSRVAKTASYDDIQYKEFFDVMLNCLFLPNTPALTNAGKNKFSMSACFVLPIEDSMESIFDTVKNAAMIHKSGGGTGFSFSRLRPKGDIVGSTNGVASGPLSFMSVYDSATEAVKQGGTRRGANMGILRVDHPDILEFIKCKSTEGVMSNFNISVAITDEFMDIVKKDGDFSLRFNGEVRKVVKVKEIWNSIVEGAWKNGEPGVIFIDRMNQYNPTPNVGEFEATNPCITGDTVVAVADGRNGVSIKQLYEEGHNFAVYSARLTPKGIWKVEIKKAIAIEKGKKEIVELTFSDGSKLKCTPGHKIATSNGSYVDAKDSLYVDIAKFYSFIKDYNYNSLHDKINVVKIKWLCSEMTYDLQVDGNHNFYIINNWFDSKYLNATGVLIHNCGEQILLPLECCVLGSVNLSKMVVDGKVDYKMLEDVVRVGVRFLDRIIDVQQYPLEVIEKMHKSNRKIGLGVMGWADMLLKLGIKYNSEEALNLAENVMSFINDKSIEESKKLAEKNGVFDNWQGSVWEEKGIKIRNATTTTIAPTGSISIIGECSSGIEPVFDWETIEKRPVGDHTVVHPLYKEWIEKVGKNNLPDFFVNAKEVSYEWHIKMQAAFQKFVHNAISKTINMLNSATKVDVEKALFLAYEEGCKGVTIYRDGSRKMQVLSSVKNIGLPKVMDAKRVRVETGEGELYVHISFDTNGKPIEVFMTTPVGAKAPEDYEAFGRILSVSLRNGVSVEKLISQLEKANKKFGSVSTIPYAIIKAFKLLNTGNKSDCVCPECGGVILYEEGCSKCIGCGYSKC